jgi:hypothetical protein
MITEMVFLGRDNENELIIELQDEVGNLSAANFTGVTRMVLSFEGTDAVVDSATDNVAINWTSDGHVSLRLGAIVIPPSKYMATLVAFDPVRDDGQVVFHSAEGRVQFWFVAP